MPPNRTSHQRQDLTEVRSREERGQAVSDSAEPVEDHTNQPGYDKGSLRQSAALTVDQPQQEHADNEPEHGRAFTGVRPVVGRRDLKNEEEARQQSQTSHRADALPTRGVDKGNLLALVHNMRVSTSADGRSNVRICRGEGNAELR